MDTVPSAMTLPAVKVAGSAAPAAGPTGVVFDIKRGSAEDGPGIRTTVFLKGCPLRCAWCRNPEGLGPHPVLSVTPGRCVCCGACADACPEGAITLAEDGAPVTARHQCAACGRCVDACPSGARELRGAAWSSAALVDELARDRPFFEASGYAPRGVALDAAAAAGLVLFDLKHPEPALHERYTGVPLHHLVDVKLHGNAVVQALYAEEMPAPYLSLLIDDCIAAGRDNKAGGARYDTTYLQGVGIGTLTDALSALRWHVYETGAGGLPQLVAALESDFAAAEPLRQRLVNRTPRYGNDDPEADELMQRADRRGPTAVPRSAAAMDHVKTGGTLLNLTFSPRAPEEHRGLLVRVAGYSDFFCGLGRELQDEIIARTEHAGA